MKTAHYQLLPAPSEAEIIEATFRQYGVMLEMLAGTSPARRSDTFELQKLAYEDIRQRTDLPSRLVINGIREYAANVHSPDRLPFDEKLFSMKGVDHVSIATVAGRTQVRCLMTGYRDSEIGSLSHLVREGARYVLAVTLSPDMQTQEIDIMQTEAIPARVSRLAAGLVNTVIDTIEKKTSEATAQQAIRDIDLAIKDAREDLASAYAERKRYGMQADALKSEQSGLDANIRLAVKEGRDDLARAGIARQDDIEVQLDSIGKLTSDVEGRIGDAEAALRAAGAARREAAERVRIAARSKASQSSRPASGSSAPTLETRIADALGAIERTTDLPTGKGRDDGVEELENFGREKRIDARLEALRAEITERD